MLHGRSTKERDPDPLVDDYYGSELIERRFRVLDITGR